MLQNNTQLKSLIDKHWQFRTDKFSSPPFELQNRRIQIVERTEVLKARYQQSLQGPENLYGSFSQKAFYEELKMAESTFST